MLASSTSDLTHNSLKITHSKDYKFFSKRLIKRDLSISNLSSTEEHYHGGSSVSVPFMWESQPGTPKVKLRETPLPPLTPPPSYCYSPIATPSSTTRKKTSKPNLLHNIFSKHNFNGSSPRIRTNFPLTPSLSPSSSSSLSSSPGWSASYCSSSVPSSRASTTSKYRGGRQRIMSSSPIIRRLSADSRVNDDDENEEYGTSPVSTLCFNGRGGNARSRTTGCYSSLIKVLLHY
ncbi:hypothetical protein PanWU01x14_286260 [Parasponia andersonii]|uniref:Uncharacterized protein n=1 Tax=Parasponia andersonii TaxID=3476 RepID=A0A2P5AZ77_PARAD|nr:hypothetical protein PanWU01x14_286260 [Parasponia andersonii]